MRRTPFRIALAVAALAMVATACSSAEPEATTTTTVPETTTTTVPETTTTTVPETTTTTEPGTEISDSVNGLPVEDDLLVERRVVAVKIDNHPRARPQFALNQADAVYEVLVEGGITRFIALFHQSDADYLGPNRSGRVTDSKIVASLAGAPFQISGAQGWVKSIYERDGINAVYDFGTTTFRNDDRPKPHNLITSTPAIREYADERGWPDEGPGNLFAYGEPSPTDGEATFIEVAFSDVPPSTWAWDGTEYLRFNGSVPHEWTDTEGNVGQVTADVLVTMKMRKYIERNPAGSGTALPTMDTLGSGEALVFHSGQVTAGTWEREAIEDPFLLTTADGVELVMPPGRVWISLVPENETITWE
jgi:hypothetical protein